jgi:TetR/AcrR family fatty acid metabolism transcriptional regulator
MGRININAIRRNQIIEAAIHVIMHKGLVNTSFDEITKKAGISRGLISYHFKNKNELLSSILDRCRKSYKEAVYSASSSSNSLLERVQSCVHRAIELIREDPINYEVLVYFAANARSYPELSNHVQRLWAEFDTNTAGVIRTGQELGVFRRDLLPEVAAAIVNSTIAGLALRWLLEPGSYQFDAVAKEAESMLIGFLTCDSASTPTEIQPED